MTMSRSTINSRWWKRGRTELEESKWRIKIRSLSLQLHHIYTNMFVIFFFWKIEMSDLLQYLFFHMYRWIRPPAHPFASCGIINVMSIMVKTLKTFEWLYKMYFDGLRILYIFRIYILVFFISCIKCKQHLGLER